MADQPQNTRYKELLDELQLQSWQLELVISGFAIFGLVSALEPLRDKVTLFTGNGLYEFKYLIFAIYFACILTIVNLIIHVLLRGLWIGAVGIRSVSGEIDFEKLNFKPLISNYLKSKIGSFDEFIEKLENFSSVMFGLTFIVILMTLGIFLNFVIFLWISDLLLSIRLTGWLHNLLAIVVYGVFLSFLILVLLDFITQGGIKRKAGKWYLPFYRLSSVLTLSILYRPLLYNLWDNGFGKKLLIWLLPIYLIGILAFSSIYVQTDYFSSFYPSSNYFANGSNYMDLIEEKGNRMGYAAIQSKIIKNSYLELSLPRDRFIEQMMYTYDSTLVPKKSRIGFKPFLFSYFHWDWGNEMSERKELKFLNALNKSFVIKIDSVYKEDKFVVTEEGNYSPFFKRYIDLSNLKRGEHLLTIQHRTSKADSTEVKHFETIPFWYFPD
jgi:hypothetical protein